MAHIIKRLSYYSQALINFMRVEIYFRTRFYNRNGSESDNYVHALVRMF